MVISKMDHTSVLKKPMYGGSVNGHRKFEISNRQVAIKLLSRWQVFSHHLRQVCLCYHLEWHHRLECRQWATTLVQFRLRCSRRGRRNGFRSDTGRNEKEGLLISASR